MKVISRASKYKKITPKNFEAKKINELLIKGYLTFEVVYQINDEVKEKRDIMCKEDDIIFSNGTTIISLS